jgi:hypothetical protein
MKTEQTRARFSLRSAIIERNAAKERLDLAQQAAERGHALLLDAENRLEKFADVDAEIVAFRAERFREAATSCRGAPPDSLALSPTLIAKERRRDEARGAVAAAKAAHASLVADVGYAEKAVRKAEQEVSGIAVEILIAEGTRKAAALRTLWRELWETQDAVSALLGARLGSLPAEAVALVQSIAGLDHRQFPGGRNASLVAAGAAWRRWHAALCADADAEFDPAALGAVEQKVA